MKNRNLYLDRINRHGLFYATKLIEKKSPPTIVINSFWRSGSTFFLELLAQVFEMRPYFEPLTPKEPAFNFLYENNNAAYNLERIHPTLEDVYKEQMISVFNATIYQSKWVYQCQTLENFRARQGKIVKLVTGTHLLSLFQNEQTKVIHLNRNVIEVVESFLNSKWTKRFFEHLDLSFLCLSDQENIARFYQRHIDYLNIGERPLIEGVAIYHTLVNKYVQMNYENVLWVNYQSLITNPIDVFQRVSSELGLSFLESDIEKYRKRPSRMTVENSDKRKLTISEIKAVNSLVDRIESLN